MLVPKVYRGERMIYIGTSGFSYDDWKGEFYPDKTAKKDMLVYYARRFNAVEINSSYYAIPGAASFVGMVKKTPDNFKFAIKAHRDMTHTEEPKQEVFDIFLGAIKPIQEADKLGCILAQFPWSFRNTAENRTKLKEFRDRVADIPTVIEFRNAEWVNQDTFDILKELDLGYCSVDEPELKGLMPPVAVATSNTGYVRFHGRNSRDWWKHEEAYERYNYLYSEDELVEWVPKVQDIKNHSENTYVFFNNHYQSKSTKNAIMLAKMLDLQLPLDDIKNPGEQMAFLLEDN